MNKHHFYKYQGTGNDFILFDQFIPFTTKQIVKLCDRRFGVGADGVIILEDQPGDHFKMLYYNSDGSKSFCGNGSRCAVMLVNKLGWIDSTCTFESNDGLHKGSIQGNLVTISLSDVVGINKQGEHYEINTGSPHYLIYTTGIDDIDVKELGSKIRYSGPYRKEGINVNFLELQNDLLKIRTYERGVEDETLSCGTGVTAAALANHVNQGNEHGSYSQTIQTKGGLLQVGFQSSSEGFTEVRLTGPAEFVFEGQLEF